MAARSTRLRAVAIVVAVLACTVESAPSQAPAGTAARIVSLVPALTEMLFALGAGRQVVAVSSYDEFPPEVQSLPRVGALLDPDMERVLSLRPDLVIVYGSQTGLQAQLARAGIRVYSYRHAGIQGILDTVQDLGAAIGRSADGHRLASDIRAQLDRLRARVQGRQKPRTLVVFERDPASLRGVFASGGVGFLHDMLEVAGGVNVFADLQREAVQPSVETLLARAPEVVLEIRAAGLAPGGAADARDVWAALASIPAVRNGRIYVLRGAHLVVPGPRVVEATEAFARALHPEVFR